MKKYSFDEVSMKSKVSLVISGIIMLTFFSIQTLQILGWIEHSYGLGVFGYCCFLAFVPPFGIVVHDFMQNRSAVIKELKVKNTYLEHAAKIIRHDMHSGINTYLPRGIKSLDRRLTPQQIKDLNIEAPMKMIREGLKHTQKVYAGVYEFTNLVKQGAVMTTASCNVKNILEEYLSLTSYKSQVILEDSLSFDLVLNDPLFCTAVDNLIRNGLKYNDSPTKYVKIYKEGTLIIIEDNGRGMSQNDFNQLSEAYTRKEKQKEEGSGLGLNICKAILDEHGFSIRSEKLDRGSDDFFKDLAEAERVVGLRPDDYSFQEETLIEQAVADSYKGRIRMRRGGRNRSRIFVTYDPHGTTVSEINKGTKIKIKFKR